MEASEPVPLDYEAITAKIIRQHSGNSLATANFGLGKRFKLFQTSK